MTDLPDPRTRDEIIADLKLSSERVRVLRQGLEKATHHAGWATTQKLPGDVMACAMNAYMAGSEALEIDDELAVSSR